MPRNRNTGGMPPPDRQESVQFLKVSDLGRGKLGARGKVRFLGEPGQALDGRFSKQMVFPVIFEGRTYNWGINIGSGNHHRLAEKFGTAPPKGTLSVTVKSFNDNAYIAID